MMGQIRDNSAEAEKTILNHAIKIVKDKKTAMELTHNITAIDRQQIYSYINIMTVLAEYLTSTNRISSFNKRLPLLVKEYLNKNYSKKITLNILSQKFGCCNATLTKSFKEEYKTSIMNYLCDIRLKKAEKMLTNSGKTVKEIAQYCGFYDQNYFSKVFTSRYGIPPKEYARRFSADIK